MKKSQTAGTENKRDCLVTATVSDSLNISVKTAAEELLGPGIKQVVERIVSELKVDAADIAVEDKGALDYVISARVETALRDLLADEVISPEVKRANTEKKALRRTRLYAPGNNARMLVGIDLHDADCTLLDLEDSVPLSDKQAARVLVKHILANLEFNEVWVRINSLETFGRDDLAEVLRGRPHGICLPKVESTKDINTATQYISQLEREYDIPSGFTFLMPIIETAKGVLHAEEIACASKRVVMVAFGAEDFTADTGAKRTDIGLLFARSMIVAAASAADIQASDSIYPDVDNVDGLVKETEIIRNLGFDGKGVINPRQIEPIHKVFAPSKAQIEHAEEVVLFAERAEEKGLGAVSMNGKMIDKPVINRARQVLKQALRMDKGGRQ